MELRIIQLNCQRAYSVVCELGQAMRSTGAVFALVQEPYTTGGFIRGLPGGMRVYTDSGGNSAIIVDDRDVDCTVVSRSEWGVCISAEGSFGRVLLSSIYCRFSCPLEPYLRYMDTVLLHASSIPLILGLDANASSPMWFSKMSRHSSGYQNCMRGRMLSEWMLTMSVGVLNTPSLLYTFDGPNGVSDIDVTAANGAAMTAFSFRWRVCDGWGISDHNLIEIVVTCDQRTRVTVPLRRWRDRDVDWDNYAEFVRAAALLQPLEDFRARTLDDQVDQIDQWMCSANDTLLGRCRKTKPGKVSWWTRELDQMRRTVRRLRIRFQRARRTGADDLAERETDYRSNLRTYKDMIVRVKEDDWRSFVRDNRDDPWGTVYRICRGKNNRQADIESLQVGDVTLSTWRNCTNELLGVFFPRAEPDDYSPLIREMVIPPNLVRSEVEDSICRVRSRKSPGMDGMTGEMCKSIWKAIPEYLEAIFGKCISEGHFPGAWKCARVVVLLKSPDRVRSNPRSYRGISLLPVLGKVLERVMVNRLKEDANESTSEFQFGFKEGRSVEDAWMHVRSSVSESSAKYVLGIFVDFKGAFDYLSWGSVLRRLEELGCRELALWKSYFSVRKACVVGASDTVWKDVVRGCPQGSICGPFIWNIMMDPLLRHLGRSFKLCAYADDLLILVEGQSRAELETKGEEVMRDVCEWGDRAGVEVAMDKTEIMLLKGRLSRGRPPLIRSGNVSLRYATEVKYLGIMMGERMNFLVHLSYIRDKLTAVVGKVRRILRSDWGLSRRAVRTIYEGLFVACATFGAPVWYETVMSVVGRNKVLSCQRVAMLGCMPVCRTVSTDALQVLLGVAPLDLEVIRRGIIFKIKKGLPLLVHDWLSASDLANGEIRHSKALLDECLVSRWRTRWTNSDKGRVTYEFIRDADFVRERPDFGFGLSLGFLLTGHGSLNAFLHKRSLSDSPECGCGRGQEDSGHVITTCPYYDDIRDLDGMGITHTGAGWDFSRVLEDDRTFRRLGAFAREVFVRRSRRLSGGSHL